MRRIDFANMPAVNEHRWLYPVLAVAGATMLLMLAVLPMVPERPGHGDLPEFPSGDADARKAAFFDYLRPIVRHRNARIRWQREWLIEVAKSESRSWLDRWHLRRLADRYRVDDELPPDETLALLLRRVDIVPESLVLVQAAVESGWGRSRFARKGNALFGERCFIEGCGMVPGARLPGRVHEVESFDTVSAAVESYLLNLNSHESYLEFRTARANLRKNQKPITGTALVKHLDSYSKRGDSYIAELQTLIRQTGLENN